VQPGRIALADGSGDTPLGIAGVALVDGALGEDEDAAVLARLEGGEQPGDPGADDDVIVVGHGLELSAGLEDLHDEGITFLDHGLELIRAVAEGFDGKVLVVQLEHPEDALLETLPELAYQDQVYIAAFVDVARREGAEEVHLFQWEGLLEAADESV
jgi:hypothetical protein